VANYRSIDIELFNIKNNQFFNWLQKVEFEIYQKIKIIMKISG